MATIDETLSLAVQYLQSGYWQAAEQSCQQILAVAPNEANAWHILGSVYFQLGRVPAAVDCLRRAVAILPDWAEAQFHLGKVLLGQQRLDEAAAALQRACELRPDMAEAHDELGLVFQKQRKLDEAVACHRRALEVNPNYAVAHNDLGVALETQGNKDEAVACYRRALQLRPNYAAALNNLGNICKDLAKLDEAIACYRRALEELPDSPIVQCGLGNVLGLSGRLNEGIACLRRALKVKPDFVTARSTLLCMMQYRDSVTLRQLADAHAKFERLHAAPLRTAWRRHENVRDPQRPIRVGFCSCDLRRHPVGFFLIRLLENLDPERCETYLYADGKMQDDVTARLRAAATSWSNVFGWNDDRLAEQIRGDRIDVLFDLAGHTSGNRLMLFARKPAPIQITWCGYAGTTGLAAMDYILADRHVIPPQFEPYYCERVLRMPDGFLCFEPPDDAPPVSPLPATAEGARDLCRVPQSAQDHAPGGGGLVPRAGAIARGPIAAEVPRRWTTRRWPIGFRVCSPDGGSIRPGWSSAAFPRPDKRFDGLSSESTSPWTPSLQRLHDDLRGIVDGDAGGDLPRRERLPAGVRSATYPPSG